MWAVVLNIHKYYVRTWSILSPYMVSVLTIFMVMVFSIVVSWLMVSSGIYVLIAS